MSNILMTIKPNSHVPMVYDVSFTDGSLLNETFSFPKDFTLFLMDEANLSTRSVIEDYMIQDEQSMIDLLGEYLQSHPYN